MRRLSLAIVALVLCVGACTSIPDHGKVTVVGVSDIASETRARYQPAEPSDGAGAQQIVSGFLDAMLAYPQDLTVARRFLTPNAHRRWDPEKSTVIYRDPVVSVHSTDEVSVSFEEVWTLDQRGRIAPLDGARIVIFDLKKVKGQWRIDNPPDELLLTDDYFEDYFRSFVLYFFDPTASVVVGEPIHAIVGETLASTLVTKLAEGPADKDLVNFVSDELADTRVHIRPSGKTTVDLTSIRSPLATDLLRLKAQLSYTLGQIHTVEEVGLVHGDNVQGLVSSSDDGTIEGFSPWDDTPVATVISQNRVFQVNESERTPLRGPWGRDARGARYLAASADVIAAAWKNKAEVTGPDGTSRVRLKGKSFDQPHVDRFSAAWFFDRSESGRRLRVVSGESHYEVALSPIAKKSMTSFDLSADGMRYAMTLSDGSIAHGRVKRSADETIELDTPTVLPIREEQVSSIQWSGSARLAFLARGERGLSIQSIRLDGTDLRRGIPGRSGQLPPVEVESFALTPTNDPHVFVRDRENLLWKLGRMQWDRLEIIGVTALS